MYNSSTCERKFELSEILTEPLNPRGNNNLESKKCDIYNIS